MTRRDYGPGGGPAVRGALVAILAVCGAATVVGLVLTLLGHCVIPWGCS